MRAIPTKLLAETITVEPFTGFDAEGTPSYGDPVTYAARVEPRKRLITNNRGEIVLTAGLVILAGAVAIHNESRLTLADGSTPSIIDASILRDGAGVAHHTEVLVG